MKINLRSINEIQPYEGNPRINDQAVDAVAASLREFGFRQPIVIDEAGDPTFDNGGPLSHNDRRGRRGRILHTPAPSSRRTSGRLLQMPPGGGLSLPTFSDKVLCHQANENRIISVEIAVCLISPFFPVHPGTRIFKRLASCLSSVAKAS